MKGNAFFRKLNFLIALGGIFAALIFYGCSNLFSSDAANDSPANSVQAKEGYGIVSGNLPSSNSASARTAMPGNVDTPSSYRVFAQSGSQKIEANVDNANATFSIVLPFGTWKVTANALLPNGSIIFTQTKTVTLNAENPNESLDFDKLGYSTNPDDGEGEISLSVSFGGVSSTISGIEYSLSKGGSTIIRNASDADLAAKSFKIEHTAEDLGAWHLTIKFYGDFSNLVYRIDQTVNVYANLKTDTFEGSASYVSGGNVVLSEALLKEFQQTTLYVDAGNGKDTNTGTQFDPLRTFNRAVELVNKSTRDSSTEFRIFLKSDVADGATLELENGKKLTVASADGAARTVESLGRTFSVAAGSELLVQSVKFKKLRFEVSGTFEMNGGEISGNTAQNGGAIFVATTGKAKISGTKIFENIADLYGGGVCVNGSGTFEMDGGEISDNKAQNGGAICTGTGIKSVVISDGTISKNVSSVAAGGVYVFGGTCEMNGGTISENESTDAGGLSGLGGGVHVHGGTFEMSGGEISGNKAKNGGAISTESAGEVILSGGKISENVSSETGGGIYVNCSLTMNGGTISKNKSTGSSGGGIYVFETTGKFIMKNGEISGNTADKNGGAVYVNNNAAFTMENGTIGGTSNSEKNAANGGGGVYVESGTFTMKNGKISGNEADGSSGSGGGVYIHNGTFTMEDGEISGNKAKGGDGESFGGGGIYLYRMMPSTPGGIFTMKGGNVSGNEAKYGGGIWTSGFSEFAMEGGEFSGNKSTDKGKGAYVNPSCTFKMKGAAKFADDNDVYLNELNQTTFATVCIAGPLSETKVATLTPSAYALGTEVLSAATGVTITQDICDQFDLASVPDGEEWKISPDSTGAKGLLKTKMDIYVRGTGGWYETSSYKDTAVASDTNSGSIDHPFATIQKAVDAIIERRRGEPNDSTSEYTIFVDGTLDGTTATKLGASGMADFSALTQDLALTIKALSGTATLDAGARLDSSGNVKAGSEGIGKCVIYAQSTNGKLDLTLENLVITGANHTGVNGVGGNGGGIYFESTGGSLTMEGCTLRENYAYRGAGIYFDSTDGSFTMNKCEVSGNSSLYFGGGICNRATLTMEDCEISGNKANYGGGVDNSGTLNITGTTISECEGVRGGGIYNAGTATITDCTIKSCKVVTPASGGDYRNGGGAINIQDGGTLTMNGGEITGNSATGSTGYGGGVFVYGSGCKFTNNGGKISDNAADSYGGGVFVSFGTFIMNDGEISDNEGMKFITDDTSIQESAKPRCGGGGVYVEGGTFTMNDGKISGNTSRGMGGGVHVQNYSTATGSAAFTMKGGTISGNTASWDGGGVYVCQNITSSTATFTMQGGTIENNTAQYGGGVYVRESGSTFTMSGSAKVSGNNARGKAQMGGAIDGGGGGIYLNGGMFTMSGGTVSGNTTAGNLDNSGGGGLYAYNKGTFTMTGGTFSGNAATNGKGAFISPDCKISMSGAAQFAGDNDVYLFVYTGSGIPTIRVAGVLSAPTPVATITPSTYAVGREVLSGDAGTITQAVCDQFALSDSSTYTIVPDGTGAKGVLKTTTVYVRGSGAPWYTINAPSATASDTNLGDKMHPFATLQKAVDAVIAMNDGTSEYTIFVDGTLTCEDDTYAYGMTSFSASRENLTVKIKALSGTATLDANRKPKGVIYAKPASRTLNLTLENLTITGGNTTSSGGGIYFDSTSGTLTIGNGTTISGNNTTKYGGGVYNYRGKVIMSGGTISGNTAQNGGGVYLFYDSTSTFTMNGGTISGNTATGNGGGVYVSTDSTFTMNGGTISGNTPNDVYP